MTHMADYKPKLNLQPTGNDEDASRQSSCTTQPKHAVIDQLFFRFGLIYGAKWTSIFDNDPTTLQLMKREWGQHLEDLDPMQIEKGLHRSAKESEWPPSIAQFRKYCIPTLEESGFPSPHQALQMWQTGQEKYPPIRMAIERLGGNKNFGLMNSLEAAKLFMPLYEACVAEYLSFSEDSKDSLTYEKEKNSNVKHVVQFFQKNKEMML